MTAAKHIVKKESPAAGEAAGAFIRHQQFCASDPSGGEVVVDANTTSADGMTRVHESMLYLARGSSSGRSNRASTSIKRIENSYSPPCLMPISPTFPMTVRFSPTVGSGRSRCAKACTNGETVPVALDPATATPAEKMMRQFRRIDSARYGQVEIFSRVGYQNSGGCIIGRWVSSHVSNG
jgi:hypothetical protein